MASQVCEQLLAEVANLRATLQAREAAAPQAPAEMKTEAAAVAGAPLPAVLGWLVAVVGFAFGGGWWLVPSWVLGFGLILGCPFSK